MRDNGRHRIVNRKGASRDVRFGKPYADEGSEPLPPEFKASQKTGVTEFGVEVLPLPCGQALEEFYKLHDQVAKDLKDDVFPGELLDRVYAILKRSR